MYADLLGIMVSITSLAHELHKSHWLVPFGTEHLLFLVWTLILFFSCISHQLAGSCAHFLADLLRHTLSSQFFFITGRCCNWSRDNLLLIDNPVGEEQRSGGWYTVGMHWPIWIGDLLRVWGVCYRSIREPFRNSHVCGDKIMDISSQMLHLVFCLILGRRRTL